MKTWKFLLEKWKQIPKAIKNIIVAGLIIIGGFVFWKLIFQKAPTIVLVSTFDENADGWTIFNGGEISFLPENGLPSGHVSSMGNLKNQVEDVPIDLVIAIDNTRSMRNTIETVKSDAKDLVRDLQKRTSDLRLGIVTITDIKSSGAPIPTSDLTEDISSQLNYLDQMGISDGGDYPEDVYAALMAASRLDWRKKNRKNDILKAVVVITDDRPKKDENTPGKVADALNALGDVFLIPIVLGNKSQAINDLNNLVKMTGGITYSNISISRVKDILIEGIDYSREAANPWYWQSPKKFRGDWRLAYNQDLSFSIKSEEAGRPFEHKEDVILTGDGGKVMTFDLGGIPGNDWVNYQILLNETEGWILKDSGTPPSFESFVKILSDIEDFKIRGDYRIGDDIGSLDNVSVIGVPDDYVNATEIKFIRASTGYSTEKSLSQVSTGEKVRIQIEYNKPVRSPNTVFLEYESIPVPVYRTMHDPKVFLSYPIEIASGEEKKVTATRVELPPGKGFRCHAANQNKYLHTYPFTIYFSCNGGYVNRATEPVEIEDPLFPRFFTDDNGHFSVDLSIDEVKRSGTIKIKLLQLGDHPDDSPDEISAVTINSGTLRPNPLSEDRWVTLDLQEIIGKTLGGSGKIYDYRNIMFNVELRRSTRIASYDSPILDRYKMLNNLRSRADFLSIKLNGRSLERLLSEINQPFIPAVCWHWLVQKSDLYCAVQLFNHNQGGTGSTVNEKVQLYALTDNSWELLDEYDFNVKAKDNGYKSTRPDYISWEDEELRAIKGMQVVLANDANRLLEDKVKGSVSRQRLFTIDPMSPERMAAVLIKSHLNDYPLGDDVAKYNSYLAAAMKFLSHTTEFQYTESAIEAGRKWKAEIEELMSAIESINSAFADSKMASLYELIREEVEKGKIIHIGQPHEGPAFTAPGAGNPNMEIDRQFDLGKTGSEIFWRGLIAFATNGRASGDLPEFSYDLIQRELDERQRNIYRAFRENQWQTPNYYPNELYESQRKDLKALTKSLVGQKDLNSVKGMLMEGIAPKKHADNLISDLTSQGRKAIYIPGYHLQTQKGTEVMDGLIVELIDGKVSFFHEYEVKSGPAIDNVEKGPRQFKGHENRINEDGLRIVNPTVEMYHFFKEVGIELTRPEINKKKIPVLNIPTNKMVVSVGESNRTLILPENVEAPRTAAGRCKVYHYNINHEKIREFASDLMDLAGIDVRNWNNARTGIIGYWNYYDRMAVNGLAPTLKRRDVEKKFTAGQRFDPHRGDWVDIFADRVYNERNPIANTNPLETWNSYRRKYIETLSKPPTEEQLKKARERFERDSRNNNNRRIDNNSQHFTPDHMYNPHNISTNEMKRIFLTVNDIPAGRESEVLRDFDQKLEEGKVYDWRIKAYVDRRYPGIGAKESVENYVRNRKILDDLLKNSPQDFEKIRRRQLAAKGSDLAASAIQALTEGLNEANRVSNQSLFVKVQRREGSIHTFVTANRRVTVPGSSYPQQMNDPPARQKLNLILWFESGEGFFTDSGIPEWLAEAPSDGNLLTWYGRPYNND